MATLKSLSTLRAHNPNKIGYKSSIYFYWFEFLKRSDPKSRSQKVREDFGDISDVEFLEWWRYTGQPLFLIDTGDDFSEFPTMGVLDLETAQKSLNAGRFMVSIDMTFPKKVIMDRLKGIVDSRAVAKIGRRSFKADQNTAYRVESKFDINALIKTLAVYDLSDPSGILGMCQREPQY